MGKRIVVVTDMDMTGSGYYFMMTPILANLARDHDVKVAGLTYNGSEHGFPFSIIPARDLMDVSAIVNNLHYLWNPDLILVAMDIPLQIQMFNQFKQYNHKYMAITPLENGPLTMSWAAPLFNMDFVFFISELGKQEAIKAGLSRVDHLLVGVDSSFWRPPINEEKSLLRKGLGIADDEFVVLTVADNQERKNLWAGMDTMSIFKKKNPNVKFRYILVTRESSPFGWKLRDLAIRMDINQELTIFNRGIPVRDLWGLYCISDAYLQPSKAEGLGMPVLEAMSCGLPCVATDTGALHELLEESRGFRVPSEYSFIDVWGNSKRDMIDRTVAAEYLETIYIDQSKSDVNWSTMCTKSREYAVSRNWDVPTKQIRDRISEIFNEPKA